MGSVSEFFSSCGCSENSLTILACKSFQFLDSFDKVSSRATNVPGGHGGASDAHCRHCHCLVVCPGIPAVGVLSPGTPECGREHEPSCGAASDGLVDLVAGERLIFGQSSPAAAFSLP